MEDINSQSYISEDLSEDTKQEKSRKWTKEHDSFIQSMVETYGTRDWNVVADNVNRKFPSANRSAKECRLRWQRRIHPSLARHHWSEYEEVQLLLAHKEYKNSWSEISKALPGKTSNSIKNRFYTIFRKVKNKIKKEDYSYDSQCEILQIHYMVEVMEEYMKILSLPDSGNDKAGKDFLYKLVQQINPQNLVNYAQTFRKVTAAHGTVQELFQKQLAENGCSEPAQIVMPEDVREEVKQPQSEGQSATDMPTDAAPMETMKLESPWKMKDCTPIENMMLGSSSGVFMPKDSPCILSAGPAAAAAFKAPCFQQDPDDVGFSEFTDGGFYVQNSAALIKPMGASPSAFSPFSHSQNHA